MDLNWYVTYCLEEFGTPQSVSEASFMDAKDGYSTLGVLYSTYGDTEHDIEVECDLVRGLTIVRADNEIVYCEKTEAGEFDGADFQSIYDWAVGLAKN